MLRDAIWRISYYRQSPFETERMVEILLDSFGFRVGVSIHSGDDRAIIPESG